MLVVKIPAKNIREGDHIYLHYEYQQVTSVEPIDQLGCIKVELESPKGRLLTKFYDHERLVIVKR